MTALVIPDKVVVQIADLQGNPILLANVLLQIHLHATRKNDFFLQPFATNRNGTASITNNDMMAEVDAHYDSGLMDYSSVESCKPDVEIKILESSEIERALVSRTTLWKMLLAGESQRWKTLEDLCQTYRIATNNRISGWPIWARFDGGSNTLEYTIVAEFR